MSHFAPPAPLAVSVPWVCESNFLKCAAGHLLVTRAAKATRGPGIQGDDRRLQGHAFRRCEACRPASFLFAIYSSFPDPHITVYPISEDSYREWALSPDSVSLSTPEMLYLLRDPSDRSFNPGWIPSR